MGSCSTCCGLPYKSCSDNEVCLLGDKEKCTFEKECEATDALVQISGMVLDAVQILRDSHKVRRQQLYGTTDALAWPRPKANAKRTQFLSLCCHVDRLVNLLREIDNILFILIVSRICYVV